MGLLDTIIGSVTGQGSTGSSGTSPVVKALLLLLAAKAASSYMSSGQATPGTAPAGNNPSGEVESGILKGLPNLDTLIDKLKGAGLGGAVESWIGHGPNAPVQPAQLESALGPDTVNQLAAQTNMPRDQLMSELSSALPQVLDKLTPDGKLPAAGDRGHW